MRYLYLIIFLLMPVNLYAASKNQFIFEIAPLRAAYGQVSIRGEGFLLPNLSIALHGNQFHNDGERYGFQDQERDIGVSGYFYPAGWSFGRMFMGAGINMSQECRGFQSERDTTTWVRTNSNERFDTWHQNSQIMTTSQTIGFRAFASEFITTSLRIEFDQVMFETISISEDEIYSSEPGIEAKSRAATKTSISFHTGFSF